MKRAPAVTLITGTSRGIGKYLAHYYVRQGHQVLGVSRSASSFRATAYRHILADVSDERAAVEIFSSIRKTYGRLDNLINNAGVASMNLAVMTPLASVRKIFETNFNGMFLFSREAAKLMSKARYGRIINFTTVAVPLQLEGELVYASSKAAVVMATQILARELGGLGITVNAIGPTPTDTDLIRGVPQLQIDRLIERQAIRRKAIFEDIANVADFFLRKESGFVTGQTLYLGGVS